MRLTIKFGFMTNSTSLSYSAFSHLPRSQLEPKVPFLLRKKYGYNFCGVVTGFSSNMKVHENHSSIQTPDTQQSISKAQ